MPWNPFKRNNDDASAEATPDAASQSPQKSASREEASREEASDKGSKGVFGRFKSAMSKTVTMLNTDIRDLVKDGRVVDDEFLDELYLALVRTDMGVGPAQKIRDDIHSRFRARKLFFKDLTATAKETIRELMDQGDGNLAAANSGPTVIMVVGVNGAGKTTSIAKLTHWFREQGKTVVLGAGDTFRAAAVAQLSVWAERMGAEIVTGREKSAQPAWVTKPSKQPSITTPTSASSTLPDACKRRAT